MIYTTHYRSPLGDLLLAGDEQGLTGLWFMEGDRYMGLGLQKDAAPRDMDYFDQTKKWLDVYFTGRDPGFLPDIHFTGSGFRNDVSKRLCQIPFGKTVTYGEIAAQLAKERGVNKMSAQAVGGAVSHNPICIIVPCHRVVGANQNLTGYSAGLSRKRALLELEGIDVGQFTSPVLDQG